MKTGMRKAMTARTSIVVALSFCCLFAGHPSASLAQNFSAPDQPGSSITDLPLPRVEDYWVSATRQPGGAVIFDGYAPDETLRTKLAALPNANTQWLRLGSGAPETYDAALDWGLSILDRLAEGRFALRDNAVTLTGIARSEDDFLAATNAVATETPAGLVLTQADIAAPAAESYLWSAQKNADGSLLLSGMVPNPDVEKILLASAGSAAKTDFQFASGQPDGFQSSARSGIALLQRLQEGRVSLDGEAWVLLGNAGTEADKAAIEADFERQKLAASGWSLAVAAPQGLPAVINAAVDSEYRFSATRPSEGTIIFDGQVPAEPALRFFGAISGGNIDAVSITDGAPPHFILRAEAGVRALMLLAEGTLRFSEGNWSLSGTAKDAATRDAAINALGDAAAESWSTDIALVAQAAPVQTAAPSFAAAVPVASSSATKGAACEAPLAEFSARNAIRFRSGAAIITPESAPALDLLATDLRACPENKIHVEGHTDSDGAEQLNLALSVARAESVVAALIERGIAPERLYAVGYGESSPIGDNATAEGKALNRRIVVKIAEP